MGIQKWVFRKEENILQEPQEKANSRKTRVGYVVSDKMQRPW